jgi:hypothetical protein
LCSFKDADKSAGGELLSLSNIPYDEEVQKKYIENYIDKVVNVAEVNGCFLFDFDSLNNANRKWYGIVDMNKRKEGFYMHKSYQVSN